MPNFITSCNRMFAFALAGKIEKLLLRVRHAKSSSCRSASTAWSTMSAAASMSSLTHLMGYWHPRYSNETGVVLIKIFILQQIQAHHTHTYR